MNLFHLFLRAGVLLGLLSLTAACNAADKPRIPMNNNDDPITHHIGRFMIEVPQSMKVAHRSASLRFRELQEIRVTGSENRTAAYEEIWKQRLGEIQKIKPPAGKEQVVIDTRVLDQDNSWTRAVAYYGNTDIPKMAYWDVLNLNGNHGLWVRWKGKEGKLDPMLNVSLDIARAYHPIYPATLLPKENVFYLEHGFIALPYVSQEEAYARFEGHPLELKLRVETTEIHKDEAPDTGLIARTAAAIASGFASGVEIKKIRSEKRKLAGLDGEEEVVSATAQGKTQLDFGWRFAGRKESGEYPKIRIRMETPDGQLDEKLKLWDALLNSFKPVGQ